MKFANEKELKTYLMQCFKKGDCWVTPIQTRTRVGVPDLYVAMKDRTFWVECKIVIGPIDNRSGMVRIPFRPGQQLWAFTHYVKTQQAVYCILASKGSGDIYILPQTDIFQDGRVPRERLYSFDDWLGLHEKEGEKEK